MPILSALPDQLRLGQWVSFVYVMLITLSVAVGSVFVSW